MPAELLAAVTVVGLCERFSCLPDQLMRQPASLLRMVKLVDRYRQEG